MCLEEFNKEVVLKTQIAKSAGARLQSHSLIDNCVISMLFPPDALYPDAKFKQITSTVGMAFEAYGYKVINITRNNRVILDHHPARVKVNFELERKMD